MQATAFEYRFRFAIHALIFLLAFSSPWVYTAAAANAPLLTDRSTWLVFASTLARTGWITFTAAVTALLVLGLVFTALGAWFRCWGDAYHGAGVVRSPTMHGKALLADGPYRRTRNPLYLGTLLHTFGIALLMTPTGALLAVALVWIFQVRLALAEEPFLAARLGQPYLDYRAHVPRFLPALRPLVPAAGEKPHWMLAFLGELYFIGAFLTLAVFGWSFNALPLKRGILISLGVWLVVRAFLPRADAAASAIEQP